MNDKKESRGVTTETELLHKVRRTLSRRNALMPRKMPQGLWGTGRGGARERSFKTVDGSVSKKECPSEKNNPFRHVWLSEFEVESSGSFWRSERSRRKRGQGKQKRLGPHPTETMMEVKDCVVGGRYNASTKTWDRYNYSHFTDRTTYIQHS